MRAVRPSKIIDILITFGQSAQRTAEIGAGGKVRMLLTRQGGLIQLRGNRAIKEETGFIYKVRGQGRDKANIHSRTVITDTSEIVGRDVVARLRDLIVEELAVHIITDCEGV